MRPPRPLPPHLIVAACALAAASCGPIGPTGPGAPAQGPGPAVAVAGTDPDRPDALEERERQVSAAIERARRSAVTLEYTAADAPSGARRVAAGVVINAEGDVLSIRIDPPTPSAPIVARDAWGRRLSAHWVASDPETGLTLLRIPLGPGRSQAPPSAPVPAPAPAEPGPEPARLGGEVIVIGNPFGLGHSVSRGHIAGLGRRLELGPRPLGGLIQVDASLHPGDSGALLANLRGEWLGLIRSGLAAPEPGRPRDHDLGFAIPARDALWVAGQLRARRRVDRAYLGVRLDLGASGEPDGALLDGVLDGGPAGRAGLRPGDRVVGLDGFPIQTAADLTDRLDRTLADTEAAVEYRRGPRLGRLVMRTASRPRPKDEPAAPPSPRPEEPGPPARALLERLERLERRLDALERRASAAKDSPGEGRPPLQQARGADPRP